MKIVFSFLILLISLKVFSQEHSKNEIGVSNSIVYLLEEKELAYGFHTHYLYNIPKTKFGVGLIYEKIFDEHKDNTFGLLTTYSIDNLILSFSPGISNSNLSLHLETIYNFEVGKFHLGPAIGYAFHPDHSHLSLGVHIGIEL